MRNVIVLALAVSLALIASVAVAQAPADNEPLVVLFDLPEDAHPLEIRRNLLDFIDGTDEQGFEDLWYLVFRSVFDDPATAAMMAWTGAGEPPELPHPNDARMELLDLIHAADDETLIGLRETLRAPLESDEARWILGLFGTHNEASDLVSVETAQCKNRIGPGPNCGNFDPRSSNCWNRVPQVAPGPGLPGTVMYPRRDMQNFCNGKILQRAKCRVYKTAYRRWARKNGNPCSFK
jgi:hypothetical protein